MKIKYIALTLAFLSAVAYADCKTQTVTNKDGITICTTCCNIDGNCNTICM